jgi:ribosomal protein S18 acetylase RimI-like enzyme
MQYPLGKTLLTSGGSPSPGYLKALEDRLAINDPEDGEEIALKAGTHFNPKSDICVCRIKDNQRLGGFLYTDYTGESLSMHSAAWTPHWINRDLLFVAFDYPFRQLGVKRIFGQTPENNQHALEFNRKCGFKVIARIEGVYLNNVACIVTRMEPEDCRLLHVRPRGIKSNRI